MAHEYIKESDTFNTSRNGTVPKPTAADISAGKVLGAGGNWVAGGGGGGGSSTLAGLDDTSITSPSDGQLLGYDGNNNKWKNINAPATGVQDVKVDGQSVVDQQGVARIAMPSVPSDLDDLSDITISNPVNGDILVYRNSNSKWENESGLPYVPEIYSTAEREVGVWTDGKPLYKKTIEFGSISAGTTNYQLNFGITTVDTLVDCNVICDISGGSLKVPMPLFGGQSVMDAWGIVQQSFSKSTGKLRLDFGTDRSVTGGHATILYTKTTDTAGSGTWTTQGTPTHHYSTSEKVIGAWIDGKPIYEKTVDCGYLSNNSAVSFPHGISNLKRVISHEGGAINSSGVYLPLPKVSPAGLQYAVDIAVTSTDIVISTGNDRTDYYAYVTLRYTKTTD